ncbi:MAG: hypothetical protein B7Z66_10795 [Chromatiales bacterium 21-64-14]|nr:MAG: hypothetical protein B7Z66_10795 [Chromatiales bacterium 21-64-14]HQU15627.1 hypothetical protein [Gammaproteobacteria bacterium]
MQLNVFLDDQSYPIDVPQYILDEGRDFFDRMDHDMDHGWQMSRQWVDNPDRVRRCQIVADRLLTALHTGQEGTLMLMAGYILTRMPGITGVQIDTTGDMLATEMLMEQPDV